MREEGSKGGSDQCQTRHLSEANHLIIALNCFFFLIPNGYKLPPELLILLSKSLDLMRALCVCHNCARRNIISCEAEVIITCYS